MFRQACLTLLLATAPILAYGQSSVEPNSPPPDMDMSQVPPPPEEPPSAMPPPPRASPP